jgi:archaellum component FlaC
MKKLFKLGVSSAFILTLMAVPVAAQRPNDVGAQERRPGVEQIRDLAENKAAEARISPEERKSVIMAEVEERKISVQNDVCERRKEVLSNVMPRLSQGATSVKKSMDTVYERVVGFYESGQLTVANYDELVSAVEVAKANSEASIQAVNEFEFELDCENSSVGEQLDGFRSAVSAAREELKVYKSTLVELISSMRAEAASSTDESTETSEDSAESEEGDSNE